MQSGQSGRRGPRACANEKARGLQFQQALVVFRSILALAQAKQPGPFEPRLPTHYFYICRISQGLHRYLGHLADERLLAQPLHLAEVYFDVARVHAKVASVAG
jgi:hypothetical protein